MLYFASGNKRKFAEVQSILSRYAIDMKIIDVKGIEIQAERLEDIARYSVDHAVAKIKAPVFVEDSGLFVRSLNGFPGPYSSYVFSTLGLEGLLTLLTYGEKDRYAEFVSVVCFASPTHEVKIFRGVVPGAVAEEQRGKNGFGFDPIFLPEKSKKTFGEMDLEAKNQYSHRSKSVEQLAKWLFDNGFGASK